MIRKLTTMILLAAAAGGVGAAGGAGAATAADAAADKVGTANAAGPANAADTAGAAAAEAAAAGGVGKAGAATAARKATAADTAGRPNAAGATNAAGPATRAGRFDTQVRDDFFAGFLGDAARLDRAMMRCEEVLDANAGDAEALVWHGAGLFFRSGEAFRSGDRARGIELATRGQAEMDRAAAIAPDSVAVRIPRGSALLAATRFMAAGPQSTALLKKGLSDYERAFQLQAGHLDKLSGHSRGELLFGLGEGWLRAGDPARARPWFERLAAMPDAGHHQQARDWLDSGKLTGGTSCVGCHTGK